MLYSRTYTHTHTHWHLCNLLSYITDLDVEVRGVVCRVTMNVNNHGDIVSPCYIFYIHNTHTHTHTYYRHTFRIQTPLQSVDSLHFKSIHVNITEAWPQDIYLYSGVAYFNSAWQTCFSPFLSFPFKGNFPFDFGKGGRQTNEDRILLRVTYITFPWSIWWIVPLGLGLVLQGRYCTTPVCLWDTIPR